MIPEPSAVFATRVPPAAYCGVTKESIKSSAWQGICAARANIHNNIWKKRKRIFIHVTVRLLTAICFSRAGLSGRCAGEGELVFSLTKRADTARGRQKCQDGIQH